MGPDGQQMDPAAMAGSAPQGMPGLPPGMDPAAMAGGMPPGIMPPGAPMQGMPPMDAMGGPGYKNIPRSSLKRVVKHLRKTGESYGSNSAYSQFALPVNLLQKGSLPPTPKGVPAVDKSKSSMIPNIAGHNRNGRVNTNIPLKQNSSTQSSILNRSFNIQR
jgi:hypothetical protein